MAPSMSPEHSHQPDAAPTSTSTSAHAASPSAPPPVPVPAPGASAPSPSPFATASPVDWSRVRLGVDPAPTMFVARWSADTGGCWDGGELVPYGPLPLMPAAQVLNYGQSIFEGLKAYRRDAASDEAEGADASAGAGPGGGSGGGGGEVLLFRADANAARFEAGARRMCMPAVPPAMFLAALHAVVRANRHWVPPPHRGSLYLRPLLLGTGALLGLCPAPSYTFIVYAVPVGSRAKDGRLTPLDYLVHDSLHRAAPRGVGSTKAAGNYSPCLVAQAQAREAGCHDCLYLDAKSDTYLEEGSGCNVFVAHGSVISTPPAAGSILPGVTRASLLQLADCLGYRIREAPISVAEAMRADEAFASGTAVVVQPIGSLTYRGNKVRFGAGAGAPAVTPAAAAAGAGSGAGTATAAAEAATASASREEGAEPAAGDCCARVGVVEATAGGSGEAGEGAEEDASASTSSSSTDNSGPVSCASHGASGDSCSTSSSSGGTPVDGVLAADMETEGRRPAPTGKGKAATEVEAEEDVVTPVPPYLNGFGRTVPYLTAEQRAALAAAAPPPDPVALPPGVGPIAQRLYGLLTSIQYGRVADPFGWMATVEMEGPMEGPLHLDRMLEDLEERAAAEAAEAEAEAASPLGPGSPGSTTGVRRAAGGVGGMHKVSSLDSFGRAPSLSAKRGLLAATGKGAGANGRGGLAPRSVFADANLE